MQQMEVEYSALLLSHTWQALPHGCKRVTIRTGGTDAVELAVASFSKTAPDAVDRFWCQIKPSVHSFSQNHDGCHHESDTMYDSPNLSCVHRVSDCFCIQRKNLEVFPRNE